MHNSKIKLHITGVICNDTQKVHTGDLILDYQNVLVEGRANEYDWTCVSGFKLFFSSLCGTG
ncbi:MAG TPA: hypothetical protein ENI80_06970 [Acidiferrobacteraceae bacterium]|nr:hypothetical protein [Acidiferrobacteraceae bacterium]